MKALLLAKFTLLGHMLHIGERARGRPLFYSSLYQALALALLLIALIGVEEGVVALGSPSGSRLTRSLGSSLHLVMARGLLLFLLLLPYVAFVQLSDALGPGNLKRLFFASRGNSSRGLLGLGATGDEWVSGIAIESCPTPSPSRSHTGGSG